MFLVPFVWWLVRSYLKNMFNEILQGVMGQGISGSYLEQIQVQDQEFYEGFLHIMTQAVFLRFNLHVTALGDVSHGCWITEADSNLYTFSIINIFILSSHSRGIHPRVLATYWSLNDKLASFSFVWSLCSLSTREKWQVYRSTVLLSLSRGHNSLTAKFKGSQSKVFRIYGKRERNETADVSWSLATQKNWTSQNPWTLLLCNVYSLAVWTDFNCFDHVPPSTSNFILLLFHSYLRLNTVFPLCIYSFTTISTTCLGPPVAPHPPGLSPLLSYQLGTLSWRTPPTHLKKRSTLSLP